MAGADFRQCLQPMATAVLEPFGFFTTDSLRAGWYLLWRIFVRVFAVFLAAALCAAAVAFLGMLAVLPAIACVVVGVVWSFTLVPRIASQWAQERYGRPLERWVEVWWGITWRTFVVAMVAAVILAVPNVVAVSLQTAYRDSTLGAVGGLIVGLLTIVNVGVSVLAEGWAMSRVTVAQLGGAAPLTPTWSPSPIPETPVEPEAAAAVEAEPAPAAAPVPRRDARPAAPAPVVASAEGKRQCPKCGLYETERGTVIGWYCKICGWREARR
jgi:hypothetical protein